MCGGLGKPVTWSKWIFQLSFLDQKLLAIKDQIPHHFFEKLELRKMHLKIVLCSAHKNNTVNSVKSFKNSHLVFLLLETMNMLCCPNILSITWWIITIAGLTMKYFTSKTY